jgi:hypothetical protein
MLVRLVILAIMLGATSVVASTDDYNPQFRWALASKGLTVATTADELTRLNETTSEWRSGAVRAHRWARVPDS